MVELDIWKSTDCGGKYRWNHLFKGVVEAMRMGEIIERTHVEMRALKASFLAPNLLYLTV